MGGRAWRQALVVLVTAALGGLFTLDRLMPPRLERAHTLSTVVTDASGAMLRPFLTRDDAWRLPATVADVDPRYIAMLKAYEDRRFAYHPGIDPLAVLRAAGQLLTSGRVVSGASTLSMQTARLLEPGRRGLAGKLHQSLRALQLEWRLSKTEILGLYLTLAPFGGNLEGVRAASLAYFGKEPRGLTLAEAALLVALPQSPERLRPDRHGAAAAQAREKVLRRLLAQGLLDPAEVGEAVQDPLPAARRALPMLAPHVAERLRRAAPGTTLIQTGLDGTLQVTLEALARQEKPFLTDGANLALLVIDNRDRRVLAHVGSADYWGPAGQIDLTRAVRSPGSTLKPFVYGMAFDDLAAHPAGLIDDRPTVFGDYEPRNFDRGYQGTVSLADALRLSLNGPAVALLDRVGPGRFAARLTDAGAHLVFPRALGGPSLPLVLGGVGTTLEDLALLFAGLADEGRVRALRYRLDVPAASRVRPLFGPAAAWYVRDALIDSPLPDGWGDARGLVRRPVAYKTGTSYGFRDAWALGVSARFTVGVWVGRPDGSTRPGVVGRNAAAPLLLRIFDLLPPEGSARPEPPAEALLARRPADLPRALQHFALGPARSAKAGGAVALEIAFPPDGATVALPARGAAGLSLRAAGGSGRLFWLVDGVPLASDALKGRRADWHPAGPGFAELTVIDGAGARAQATVRLVAPAR